MKEEIIQTQMDLNKIIEMLCSLKQEQLRLDLEQGQLIKENDFLKAQIEHLNASLNVCAAHLSSLELKNRSKIKFWDKKDINKDLESLAARQPRAIFGLDD